MQFIFYKTTPMTHTFLSEQAHLLFLSAYENVPCKQIRIVT
jgi:hypothetical protein